MTNTQPIILIIDDEQAILTTLQQALEDEGYFVRTLDKPEKALELIGTIVPDLVLLDIFMPNHDGLDILKEIKKEYPAQNVMMISGFGNISLAIKALKRGAMDFIEKPLNLDEILAKLSFLLEQSEAPGAQPTTHFAQHGIVGTSYTFTELLRQAQRIAPLDLPVIIHGEPGTGKNLIARYIDNNSGQTQKNRIELNCSAGTADTHTEKIKAVFNGQPLSFLVRHIHQLSPENQSLLLEFINNDTDNKVRIIATSTKSLFQLSQNGEFNTALFQVLNVIPLEIPALRKHAYDVPLLADHFLQRENERHTRNVVLNAAAIRQLRNHTWPGNVTELKAAITKLVAIAHDNIDVIMPEHVVEFLGERNVQLVQEQTFSTFDSLDDAKQTFEKTYISYLLKKNHYNLDQVCGMLNISHSELKNKILELGLSR